MTTLTVVLGFRDRELERLRRCLESLAAQSFRDFRVHVVDYGSTAVQARPLIEQYDFCRYICTDTRGRPWNRSHCLNIGARLVETPYVMTTDVDMVFPVHFIDVVAEFAAANRVLYCHPYFLPKGFSDWQHLNEYAGKVEAGNRNALGGCQVLSTEIFHQIRGFDEFYRYWGAEDRDLNYRFKALGLEEVWLNDQIYFFHQWHPAANHTTRGFIPDGVWNRIVLHAQRHRSEVVRNNENWGQILTTAERPVLAFIDLNGTRLNHSERLHVFDESPTSNQSVASLALRFYDLLPGHALAVTHASFPEYTRWAERILHYGNRFLQRTGAHTQLDYSHNLVHSFIVELIEHSPSLVSDYYLNFPVQDGVSLLLHA